MANASITIEFDPLNESRKDITDRFRQELDEAIERAKHQARTDRLRANFNEPSRNRDIYVSYQSGEATYAELARRYGVSPNRIRSIVARGRRLDTLTTTEGVET